MTVVLQCVRSSATSSRGGVIELMKKLKQCQLAPLYPDLICMGILSVANLRNPRYWGNDSEIFMDVIQKQVQKNPEFPISNLYTLMKHPPWLDAWSLEQQSFVKLQSGNVFNLETRGLVKSLRF